tara:strand:- start:70 stop:429 length:360 start_codon:yes stop_codon:yes gene_type:complete
MATQNCKDCGEYIDEANFITEDGYSFWVQSDGTVNDTPDGINFDMSWNSVDEFLQDMDLENIYVIGQIDDGINNITSEILGIQGRHIECDSPMQCGRAHLSQYGFNTSPVGCKHVNIGY